MVMDWVNNTRCPLCTKPESRHTEMIHHPFKGSYMWMECESCGDGVLYEDAHARFEEQPEGRERFMIACRLRERSVGRPWKQHRFALAVDPAPVDVMKDRDILLWDDLVNSFPKSVGERMDRGLIGLSKMIGDRVGEKARQGFLLQRCLFALDGQEAGYLQDQLANLGLIEIFQLSPQELRLTAKGWARANELMHSPVYRETRTVFFAFKMSDDDHSRLLQRAFKEVCKRTGFEPVIVNTIEHLDTIDDRILYELNRARFVVCELTGHKPNVYFEAGYALGMNHQVVWACRKDDMVNLQFDVKMYPMVVWDTEATLIDGLTNRINANIR